jgi:phosphoribosylglycinamide formyltransferase-1
LRCVIVASTGGSVMNELLKNAFFKNQIFAVLSDRACPAIEKARHHGVRADIVAERDKGAFSARVLEFLEDHRVDYVISFYTKLFVGELLERYRDRVINLHPSVLPAFKGLNAFADALNSGTRYIGTTIHFIDERTDEGKIILQTMCPLDAGKEETVLRHRIFQHQCKSLLQVTKWLVDGRVSIQGRRVIIEDASFTDYEFSPALDFEDAIRLDIPPVVGSGS